MRSPGSVYRKLKEIKFRYLVILYKQYMRRTPENCLYNYEYTLNVDGGQKHTIRLCLLHQPDQDMKTINPAIIDVCTDGRHSNKCNAFVNKHTKEDIKNILETELKNNNIKEKKYPEICALEWVLERSAVGTPPITWIQRLYFFLKKLILRNKII